MKGRQLTLEEALAPLSVAQRQALAPMPKSVKSVVKHTHPPHLRDFSFNNYTGHVLTEKGLVMLLEATCDLHLTDAKTTTVRGVPCMGGVKINVIVDQHGNAR